MIESILVVAPHLGVLTACASTLDELTARRTRVHIAVHHDPPLGTDLSVFTAKFRRLTVGSAPAPDDVPGFLRAHEPDVLIVLPIFGAGSLASSYVPAAAEAGIPTLGFPLRWDDPMRADLPALPDCVALWNREQRRQMVEGLGVPSRRTVIVGAPLRFDIVPRSATTRAAFCERRGLDPARRIVLYAPGRVRDSASLTQWIESLKASADPLVREAQTLVCLPPPGRVEQTTHPPLPDALVVPRAACDPSQYDVEIVEALTLADVLLVRDTSLLFEAAARGRPTVALLWPDGGDRDLARVCAEVGPSRGWPVAAHSLDEHVTAVATLLTTGLSADRQAAARAWVRPHGLALSPGFLLSARVLQEAVDRRADTPVSARVAVRRAVGRENADEATAARVLIAVASARSLALHQPLLRTLAERGHALTILFTARAGFPVEQYERVRCDVPGVAFAGTLTAEPDRRAAISRALIGVSSLATVVRDRPRGTIPSWLARYASAVLPGRLRRAASLMLRVPVAAGLLARIARRAARTIRPSERARSLLVEHKPDVVVVLPDDDALAAFESADTQSDVMRAAESLGIPVASAAGATEIGIHAAPTASSARFLFVWNDEQRRAVRARGIHDDRIVVTGALPLDRCLDESPVVDALTFRTMLGLPADRPFALFVGSTGLLSEPRAEADLVQAWVKALRESTDPVLRDLVVLVRPSPIGTSRWRALRFGSDRNVVVCPDTFERSGELDTVLLAESVRFAAVTMGADPLALLMAAALDRPAVAVVPARAAPANGPLPLDYLWRTDGSSVRFAATLDELTRHVRAALDHTARPSAGSFRRVHVRPHADAIPSLLAADCIEQAAFPGR